MRIWLFSDLHLEHHTITAQEFFSAGIPDADVCVVPGDLHSGFAVGSILETFVAPHMPVIYVPGNHDYYGLDMPEQRKLMSDPELEKKNIHILDPGATVIKGVRFIGATLWTDYAMLGENRREDCMATAETLLNDHRLIANGKGRIWSAGDALERHRQERAYIEAELSKPFDGPSIVVTHHTPSTLSIHPRFLEPGSLLANAAFSSDLHEIMEAFAPELWVHGHTHDSFDYTVGSTRVAANPRGYQVKTAWNPRAMYQRAEDGSLVDVLTGMKMPEPYEGPENRAFDRQLVLEVPIAPHLRSTNRV